MGRKRHTKIPGTVDWTAPVKNIQMSDRKLVERIAIETDVTMGNMLRDWIVEKAQTEAHRLNLLK